MEKKLYVVRCGWQIFGYANSAKGANDMIQDMAINCYEDANPERVTVLDEYHNQLGYGSVVVRWEDTEHGIVDFSIWTYSPEMVTFED